MANLVLSIPDFLTFTLLTFWAGKFFVVGGCPVPSRIFSSILGLYQSDACQPLLPPRVVVMTTKNVPWKANHPQLRVTDLYSRHSPHPFKIIWKEIPYIKSTHFGMYFYNIMPPILLALRKKAKI